MSLSFQVSALPVELFRPLFTLDQAILDASGATVCVADSNTGYPCRVSLIDAEVGEQLILLSFAHHDVESPYKSLGPIYVRVEAAQAFPGVNEVPFALRRRLLSIRAYSASGDMIAADVTQGHNLEHVVDTFFADDCVQYLHLHNAKPGCYNCRVDRV